MDLIKKLSLLLLAILCISTASAKKKIETQPVYMFGYALSPADSTVYVTDIQRVEPAYIQTSTGFLAGRALFSQQFQDYLLQSLHVKGAACNIFFNTKRAKVQKKYDRVTTRAKNDEDFKLCLVANTAYTFQALDVDPEDIE